MAKFDPNRPLDLPLLCAQDPTFGARAAGAVLRRRILRHFFCKLTLTLVYSNDPNVDTMLRALADGTRRQILALVWRDERSAGEIAAEFTMTRPAVSQHLAVLRDSKLVSVRPEGTRRLYRANRQAVARLRAELGVFWDDSLAQLRDVAEASERKGGRR
jgi:DNA-binding transcriptional ArsR family regulator